MDIQTPREFFEKVLPERFDPSRAKGIDIVVQLNIAGDNGGQWHVMIKDEKLQIKEGEHPEPKITVEMKDRDWVRLINGKLTGERAYLTGKLKLKGEVSDALRLKEMGIL